MQQLEWLILGLVLGAILTLLIQILARRPKSTASRELKTQTAPNSPSNDQAVIAAISAALSIALGGEEARFRVKAIRREGNGTPVWSQAGLNAQLKGTTFPR